MSKNGEAARIVHEHIMKVVQEAIMMGDMDSRDGAYVAAMAGLGGLIPMTLTLGKKPIIGDPDELTGNQKKEIMCKMVSDEALLFCALLTANVMQSLNVKTGDMMTGMGPDVLWETLQMWQLLNKDKKPEDYLDNGMIAAAIDHGKSASAPFDEFLKKRADDQGHQTPKTLQ